MRSARSLALSALILSAVGCRTNPVPAPQETRPQPRALSSCPVEAPAPPQLPFARTVHSLPAFWLGKLPEAQREAELLDRQQLEAHNKAIRKLRKEGWLRGRWDPLELRLDPERVRRRLARSVEQLRRATDEGKRVLADGTPPRVLITELAKQIEAARPASELRLVHRSEPLRCYPTPEGIFEQAWEEAFDLVQCAQLRLGEPVRVFAKGSDYWYVWSSYASGWVRPAALTPPLDDVQAEAFLRAKRFIVVRADMAQLALKDGATGVVRMGTVLPLLEDEADRYKVRLPTAAGLGEAWIPKSAGVGLGYDRLTRGALLRRAFSLLNAPYGWGGMGGHRDCSRLLMDLFATFGLIFPRNSIRQSLAGTRHVEVGQLDDAAKVDAIQQAAEHAVVLLYLPGHIMLYLGRDGDHLYALHQFSGYLVPCDGKARTEGGRETMMRVNRTVVTSLELGRGSSRKSFLERITRLVLLEPPPPLP